MTFSSAKIHSFGLKLEYFVSLWRHKRILRIHIIDQLGKCSSLIVLILILHRNTKATRRVDSSWITGWWTYSVICMLSWLIFLKSLNCLLCSFTTILVGSSVLWRMLWWVRRKTVHVFLLMWIWCVKVCLWWISVCVILWLILGLLIVMCLLILDLTVILCRWIIGRAPANLMLTCCVFITVLISILCLPGRILIKRY